MAVLLSCWQFGVTITYHFRFVPLTIGLALLGAVMQVFAYRRRDQEWERLTRFFGALLLIDGGGVHGAVPRGHGVQRPETVADHLERRLG